MKPGDKVNINDRRVLRQGTLVRMFVTDPYDPEDEMLFHCVDVEGSQLYMPVQWVTPCE